MTKFVYLIFTLLLVVSLTSCGAGCSAKSKTNKEIAGYTLKNKKEIMEQQILYKKSKTIVVIP